MIIICFSNTLAYDTLKPEKNLVGVYKMSRVSEIQQTQPEIFKTELQEKVYQTLNQLQISFDRVDTEEAITMEDCIAINEKLNMKMVKTLFLCNRQQTDFYLLPVEINRFVQRTSAPPSIFPVFLLPRWS